MTKARRFKISRHILSIVWMCSAGFALLIPPRQKFSFPKNTNFWQGVTKWNKSYSWKRLLFDTWIISAGFSPFPPSSNGVSELGAKIQSLRAITTKAQHPISPSKHNLLLKYINKSIFSLACKGLGSLATARTSQTFQSAIAEWWGSKGMRAQTPGACCSCL